MKPPVSLILVHGDGSRVLRVSLPRSIIYATAGLFVHDGGVLNVTDCLVSGNTNAGGNASGLLAQTSGIMRVSNSTITDNDLGLSFLSGGQLLSRLNNTVEGNGIDGTFSGTYGSK